MNKIKSKALALADIILAQGYTDNQKDIWAEGFIYGYQLGLGRGSIEARDEIIRKILTHGYKIDPIYELQIYLESLQMEEK